MKENKNNELQADALESVAGGDDEFEKALAESENAYRYAYETLQNGSDQYRAGEITYEELKKYYEHADRLKAYGAEQFALAEKLREQNLRKISK